LVLIVIRLFLTFFFSSRRRHTRFSRDWSSDVCSSDLIETRLDQLNATAAQHSLLTEQVGFSLVLEGGFDDAGAAAAHARGVGQRSEERRVGNECRSGWGAGY